MMICEYIDSCTLIHKMNKSVPFTVNMMKIRYCESNKHTCARYTLLQVFEMDQLPTNLWPSDEEKALEILEAKSKKL